MENVNIKNMLAELKREFREIYEVPYNGLYVIISDSYGKTYEDENDNFDERDIDEVDIVYQGDEIAIYPNLFGKCEIRTGAIECKNLDVIARVIVIVGKHLKNINKKGELGMITNENFLNMFKELDSEFPDDFGLLKGLRIDAIDLKGNYDDCIDFDEKLLDEVRIYYKNKTILIKRYNRDNWEIEDEEYIKFEDFIEIGKILSIVMKHISRIELD